MIPASEQLGLVVAGGSFRSRLVADLVVEDTVVLADLPLEGTELTSDAGQAVLTTGEATVVYRDGFGTSITPRDTSSWLAPFVSRLDVSMLVEVGNQFSEKVLRGRLRVVGVGDVQESFLRRKGARILYSVGARIKVELADHFHAVDASRFPIPTAPRDLSSVQREMSRLTGLPVQTSIPDGPIPRSVTYEESRLDAVNALASVLGGYAYVTPDGSIGLVSKTPGDVVLQVRGTAKISPASGMSDDGVYNQVVVTTHDDQQAAILATASITSGPLRVSGPFGVRPYKASSPYITTAAQARAYAESLLPQVSRLAGVKWTVTMTAPDPRIEVWDVIEVVTPTAVVVGQVVKITLSDRGMVLDVQEVR